MADVGTGTTMSIGGMNANLLSVRGPGMARISVEISHMGTTAYHAYMPGDLVDPGELELEFEFNATTAPPMSSSGGSIVVDFPNSYRWLCDGFMTAYTPTAELEERMTASATIKLTGAVAVSSGGTT